MYLNARMGTCTWIHGTLAYTTTIIMFSLLIVYNYITFHVSIYSFLKHNNDTSFFLIIFRSLDINTTPNRQKISLWASKYAQKTCVAYSTPIEGIIIYPVYNKYVVTNTHIIFLTFPKALAWWMKSSLFGIDVTSKASQ